MNKRVTDEPISREAELARLADGSLPAARADALRAEVARSPELAAALAEQERAVALMRSLGEPAPASLRAAVAVPATARRRARRTPATVLAGAAVAAVAAVIVVILVARSGGAGAPTLPETARLALAAATLPAPAADPSHPGLLTVSVDGLAFPDWARAADWGATGARSDALGGRRIVTVFYTWPAHGATAAAGRVGYAIVSGAPLSVPAGRRVTSDGVRFVLMRQGGAELVTWRRDGHTCVLASRSLDFARLVALAGVYPRSV